MIKMKCLCLVSVLAFTLPVFAVNSNEYNPEISVRKLNAYKYQAYVYPFNKVDNLELLDFKEKFKMDFSGIQSKDYAIAIIYNKANKAKVPAIENAIKQLKFASKKQIRKIETEKGLYPIYVLGKVLESSRNSCISETIEDTHRFTDMRTSCEYDYNMRLMLDTDN